MSDTFLNVQNLTTWFPVEKGLLFRKHVGNVKAVDGIDLKLKKGEILGLVGESGCGKSTLGRSILQLVPVSRGTVELDGVDLTKLGKDDLRSARNDFQMIFQDPYASLNPRMSVYDTLTEALTAHSDIDDRVLPTKVAELMDKVGLSRKAMRKYPHEFSGGQRQRIAIARALAVEPKLIVADEPVSALDVSIQSQIINLLEDLCRDMGLTLIFISHDLSVVKHISDRIAVMYLGKLVELGEAVEVMEKPLHAYTQALLSAVPSPDPKTERTRKRIVLKGDPPSPMNPPEGCAFAHRSWRDFPSEYLNQPGQWTEVTPGHWVEVHPATVEDWQAHWK